MQEKKFEFASDIDQLKPFRDELSSMLDASGFDEKAKGEVLLAVQEALTNVIRHTYKGSTDHIEVTIREDDEQFKISIRDYGEKFDLTQVPDPELPKPTPGGLGIFLIKNVMDQVEYDGSMEKGNLLHLIKFKNRTEQS